MAHRIERRQHRSALTRARMLAAPAAILQFGLRTYGCRNLWDGSASSIIAGIIVEGTVLLLVVLAIRKPWGASIVLLTAFTVIRILVNVTLRSEVDVVTALIDTGIAAALTAAFTIAFRDHYKDLDSGYSIEEVTEQRLRRHAARWALWCIALSVILGFIGFIVAVFSFAF